jgi:putative aminopeptidase FrvX
MHSPIEIVELADLEACVRLLVGFAARLRPGETWGR